MPKFFDGIDHRQDILGRDFVHDGVYWGQHIATSRPQNIDDPFYLLANIFRASKGQEILRVDGTTKA